MSSACAVIAYVFLYCFTSFCCTHCLFLNPDSSVLFSPFTFDLYTMIWGSPFTFDLYTMIWGVYVMFLFLCAMLLYFICCLLCIYTLFDLLCHLMLLTFTISNKTNCELMLTYDAPTLWQTGSRNLTGQKTLPTIWCTYMKLVTKYQISAINSC